MYSKCIISLNVKLETISVPRLRLLWFLYHTHSTKIYLFISLQLHACKFPTHCNLLSSILYNLSLQIQNHTEDLQEVFSLLMHGPCYFSSDAMKYGKEANWKIACRDNMPAFFRKHVDLKICNWNVMANQTRASLLWKICRQKTQIFPCHLLFSVYVEKSRCHQIYH